MSILQSEALLEEKRQMAVIKDRPVGCDLPEMRRNVLGSAECGRNRNAHPGEQEGRMTLDEAIKHAEEVAEKNERRAESVRNRPISSADFYHEEESCSKCATEHRQLAEWLKELKRHREAWMNVVSEVDQHTEIHSDGEFYIKNFDVKKIVAEYRPKDGTNDQSTM